MALPRMAIIFRILIISLFFLQKRTFAQNLIPNPNFELINFCPNGSFSQLPACKYWRNPGGTVDYFHTCDKRFMESTSNYFGEKEIKAYSEDGFIGLYFFSGQDLVSNNDKFYDREYLQTKLLSPLIKNKVYQISLFLCVGVRSGLFTKSISFSLSPDSNLYYLTHKYGVMGNHKKLFINKNRVTVHSKPGFKNTSWEQITAVYKAKGGEEFLTLGIFNGDQSKKRLRRIIKKQVFFNEPYAKIAYYFVDDFCMVEINTSDIIENNPPKVK